MWLTWWVSIDILQKDLYNTLKERRTYRKNKLILRSQAIKIR